jgi:hypothetical protein
MNAYTALGAGGRGFESRHPDQRVTDRTAGVVPTELWL